MSAFLNLFSFPKKREVRKRDASNHKREKLKTTVEKLNALIKQGKIRDAFEKYYREDVVIQLNGSPPLAGKEANGLKEMGFLQEIKGINSSDIKSVTFGGIENDVSMTEWGINIQNPQGEQKTIYRVNVQHWKDNKIFNEKLYLFGAQKF